MKPRYTFAYLLLLITALFLSGNAYGADNSGMVFTGRVTNPDGTPMTDPNSVFNIKIYASSRFPSAGERCLLYEEIHRINLAPTNGSFSLVVGEGTPISPILTNITQLFVNPPSNPTSQVAVQSYAIPAKNCESGGNLFYPDRASADRELDVTVTTSFGKTLNLGSMPIRSVPFAMQASQISGYGAKDLLKINSSQVDKANNIISQDRANFLIDLYDGTSVNLQNKIVRGIATPASTDVDAAPNVQYVNERIAQQIGSGVMNLNVTAPLIKAGTANNVQLSLQSASSSQAGFLSAADWNMFNNKFSAVVTSPTSGQVMSFNGSSWVNGSVSVSALPNLVGDVTGTINANIIAPNAISSAKIQDGAVGNTKIADGSVSDSKISAVAFSKVTARPTNLSGYGITDAVRNDGAVPSIQAGDTASRPAFGNTGKIYIDTQSGFIYRDTGTAWATIGGSGGVTAESDPASWLRTGNVEARRPAATDFIGHDANFPLQIRTANLAPILFQTGSQDRMAIASDGKIGIGTITPSSAVDVRETLNALPSQVITHRVGQTISEGDPAGQYIGSSVTSAYNGSSNILNRVSANEAYADHTGAGNIGNLKGYAGRAMRSGTGRVTFGIGGEMQVYNQAGGEMGIAVGAQGRVFNNSTTGSGVAFARGLSAIVDNSGTMDSAYGVHSTTSAASGTINTNYGVRVDTAASPGANITNWYGVYVDQVMGTAPLQKRHPLYIVDPGASYFAGSVGIGTDSPLAKLDVAGAVKIGSDASLTNCNLSLAGTLKWSGTEMQVCDGSTWKGLSAGSTGSVTSVSMTMNRQVAMSNFMRLYNGATYTTTQTVNSSGSFEFWLMPQAPNKVFAGPLPQPCPPPANVCLFVDYPTFRSLAASDLPSFVGDVTGPADLTKVERIQGRAVSSTAPSSGQSLVWNGTQWAPSAVGSVTSVGLTADSRLFNVVNSPITSSGDIELQLKYLPVDKAGDTMTGKLNLPVDGLSVGTNQMVVSGGQVGIGTTTPRAALDVNGAIVGKPAVLNASSIIDFGTGNKQFTNGNCGTFNLHNLKDGGSYLFAVYGGIPSTCSFNAFSDAGTTPLNVRYPVDHAATASSTTTVYSFVVMGNRVLVAWSFVN